MFVFISFLNFFPLKFLRFLVVLAKFISDAFERLPTDLRSYNKLH